MLERRDYHAFGEEIAVTAGSPRETAPGYTADAGVRQKFTGKERDAETGLDYFGARYFSGAQGRFTTVDPSMLSTVMANPESWNRYAYALHNPLRYVDPNGELWIASGDANNPYSCVDECEKNQTCYENVAAVVGASVRVYGSRNAPDITNYTSNENGVVNIAGLAGHVDVRFEVAGGQRYPEEYLAPSQAAALFNVARDYRAAYPNDSELVFTAGSAATGGPAVDATGQPVHSSHQGGANIDIRYMGPRGCGGGHRRPTFQSKLLQLRCSFLPHGRTRACKPRGTSRFPFRHAPTASSRLAQCSTRRLLTPSAVSRTW